MVDRYAVPVSTRGPSGATNAYIVGDSDRLLSRPAGHSELAEIVEAASQKDISSVVGLAWATVLVHLETLAVEESIT